MIEPGIAYGCLFCETGHEQEMCDLIEYKCPDIRVRSARYVRHRTKYGVHTRETKVFIPGYVFFRCEDDIFKPMDFPRDRIFKLLKNEVGDWRLIGGDFAFAQWLFTYDGLLDFSTAYVENGWVSFLSGPLKDMEDKIMKIERRGRSGLIEVDFNGKKFRAWLGFNIVDKPEGAEEEEKTEERLAFEARRARSMQQGQENGDGTAGEIGDKETAEDEAVSEAPPETPAESAEEENSGM